MLTPETVTVAVYVPTAKPVLWLILTVAFISGVVSAIKLVDIYRWCFKAIMIWAPYHSSSILQYIRDCCYRNGSSDWSTYTQYRSDINNGVATICWDCFVITGLTPISPIKIIMVINHNLLMFFIKYPF
jgi:hypothetical protein